jgi:hypothetical protein
MKKLRKQVTTPAKHPRDEIPKNAVAADSAQQVPNNSYSPPPRYYVDREFQCIDCGRKEIWTATQQKWYYEVAKGSLYSGAVRCRACRRKHKETHSGRGDPNPIKHVGSLRKHIRSRIAPVLIEAGYKFDRQSGKDEPWLVWIEYASPVRIIRCMFDSGRGHLTAESLDDTEWKSVVDVETGDAGSTTVLLERIDQFADRIREFVHASA